MRTILLLLLYGIAANARAQQSFAKNTVYGEFLGNGIFASVNYERQLQQRPGLGIRIGLGYYSGDEQFRFSFPAGINYLFRLDKYKSFLDIGAGLTWSSADGMQKIILNNQTGRDTGTLVSFIPSVGYRHHTRNNLMWRISFTPIINKYRVIPLPAFTFGKRF